MPARPPSAAVDPAVWRGRRVLLTGHTGFKGAWLSLWLQQLGAELTGLAHDIPTDPSLFVLAGVEDGLARHVLADVRDADAVRVAIAESDAEVVLHLAAQPLVRRGYAEPRRTYETNVMGTVNVLDAVRTGAPGVRAVVVVTSDKCYARRGEDRPFVEDDPLGGPDPYASSKGAAELVVAAYRRSFFSGPDGPRLASARAGNVLGGGDWGEDRLVPDLVRAAGAGVPLALRHPDARRPWQHVLEPLSGYLLLAQGLLHGDPVDTAFNLGPAPEDVRPVRWVVERLAERWPCELAWERDLGPHPPEAPVLALDSTRARERLGWRPRWGLERALEAVAAWHAAHAAGADVRATTLGQLAAFGAP